MERIILAGGSGFLGGVFTRYFAAKGFEVVVLTRQPRQQETHAREVFWDGETLGDWVKELEGAQALINLAGRSVDCRYHARNRKLMMDSRLHSTRVLGEAIARCKEPPQVWLNSSTATIYRHSLDRPWDEGGEIGATPDAFSVEIATAWERVFDERKTPKTRKIAMRTAMVFGASGSVFRVLRRLVRCGLGGRMGNGNQYVSWIHEEDCCRAIEWLLEHDEVAGIVNMAAPNPVTNKEMMRIFREICGVPFGLPAEAWMLEVGAFFLRTEAELIIKSRRVVPGRLAAAGFKFKHPTMRDAIEDLCARGK
ncbi:MAG: TIGR01777 family oxidoreductase [Verrucomicrobiota bacterium]